MQTFEHGYALIFGVDESSAPAFALPAVKHDVSGLAAVLRDPAHCGYLPDNVMAIAGAQATRDGLLAGFKFLRGKLAKDNSGDTTVVVYFSGHGHRDGEDYFLLPFNIDPEDLRGSGFNAAEFASNLARLNPSRLLVMLDCCHAGGVGALSKGIDPAAAMAPAELNTGAMDADWLLGRMPALSVASKSIDLTGLQGVDETGRAIISSSTGAQRSYVRADGRMSIFTYHVIEALTGQGIASNDDNVVKVLELALYLDAAVPKTAKKERGEVQRPTFKNDGVNFPVSLVGGGAGKAAGVTDVIAMAEQSRAAGFGNINIVNIAGDVDTNGGDFIVGAKNMR